MQSVSTQPEDFIQAIRQLNISSKVKTTLGQHGIVDETHDKPTYRYREPTYKEPQDRYDAMCSAVDGHLQSQTNHTGHNTRPLSAQRLVYDSGAQYYDRSDEDTMLCRGLDRQPYAGVSPTGNRLTKVMLMLSHVSIASQDVTSISFTNLFQ